MNSNQADQNAQGAALYLHAHVYVYQVGETLVWEKPNENGTGYKAYTAVVKAVGDRTHLGYTYDIHVASMGADHLARGVLHGQLVRPEYHH